MPETARPTQEEIDQSWRDLSDLLMTGDPYTAGSAAEEIPHDRRVALLARQAKFRAEHPGLVKG